MYKDAKTAIPYVIIGILVTIIFYIYFNPNKSGLIDTKVYDEKIENLEKKVKNKDYTIDSLITLINDRQLKITEYEVELDTLENKFKQEKKRYEKEIERINAMSNSGVVREFTIIYE